MKKILCLLFSGVLAFGQSTSQAFLFSQKMSALTFTFQDFTNGGENGGSVASLTSDSNLTLSSGNLVVIACRSGGDRTFTFSDSAGSTYSTITRQLWLGSGASFQIGYTLNSASGSSSFTCTPSSNASNMALVVLRYSVSGGTPVLDTSASTTASSSTSWTSPSFSTASGGLVVACATLANIATYTAGAIGGNTATLRGPSPFDTGCEDTTFSSAQSSITAAISTGGSNDWGGSVIAFK